MPRQRPDADERFRRDIDDFNFWDLIYKEAEKRRKLLTTRIRNKVRRKGRGVHNGHESSIYAHDVTRRILSQEAVQEILSPQAFSSCFRPSTYIQLDGGPLRSANEVVPELGPPEEVIE